MSKLPVLIVILANGAQAQTGGQPLPEADRVAIVEACGVPVVAPWPLSDVDIAFDRLANLMRGELPAAVFVNNGN
jgi:indolepyruvate ferredoxin oxidoreductase alpha subunit